MKKIKIGILVNDLMVPLWLYESIQQIQSSNYAEISAIILKKNIIKPKNKKIEALKILPLLITYKIDKKIFGNNEDALKLISIEHLSNTIPIIEVQTIETKFKDTFSQKSLEDVKNIKLDILFRSGFKILSGKILSEGSNFGVWSFHHGDNRYFRGAPACFWEVYNKNPTSGFVLQKLTEVLDGGLVIAKGEIPTTNYSLYKTRQTLYWDAQGILIILLKKLHNLGFEKFNEEAKIKYQSNINIYDRPLYKSPDFKTCLLFLFQMQKEWANIIIKNHFNFQKREKWFLGWMKNEKQFVFRKIKKIIPPRNNFWADPFIINFNKEDLIFFEDFENKKGKGRISVLKYDKILDSFCNPTPVLETDYHLSFPFTFINNNKLYVIPESKSINQINLFEWDGAKLVFKCTLIDDIKAVDTTILFKDDKYWLFTCKKINSYGSTFHQYIYYSDKLEGPYISHCLNPITSSSKISRAAGSILNLNNKLFRVSQDCSDDYGKKIHLHEIIELTTFSYKEVLSEEIEANWEKSIKKTHTLNTSDNFVVIDMFGRIE
jgi:hypothetical protein